MSYKRPLIAAVATAALIVLFMTSGPTTGADNDLQTQVAQLSKRVAALESAMGTMATRMNASHPDARTEQAAAQALLEVNQARQTRWSIEPNIFDSSTRAGSTLTSV